jgi:hypothetical protein
MPGEDLEDRVASLETAVRELRAELRPRGLLGLPRPPTPGELARAADEHAIPAAIASLTAAIHALELLRALLRASGRRPGDAGGAETHRSARVGTTALAHLDSALSDLSTALAGEPPDAESRELLAEARALRAEIAERIEAASETAAAEGTEERDSPAADDDAAGTAVDVEAELDSIRDELDDEDQAGDAT